MFLRHGFSTPALRSNKQTVMRGHSTAQSLKSYSRVSPAMTAWVSHSKTTPTAFSDDAMDYDLRQLRIDVDKMDYFRRDAYFLGIQRQFDHDRYLKSLRPSFLGTFVPMF